MTSNFDENKKVITLRSFFLDAFRFNRRSFFPCVVPLDSCVGFMLQSGGYVLSPEFVTMYRKMDYDEASIYWQLVHDPEKTTINDVRTIVFDPRSYERVPKKRYFAAPASVRALLNERRQKASFDCTNDDSSEEEATNYSATNSVIDHNDAVVVASTVTPLADASKSRMSSILEQCRKGQRDIDVNRKRKLPSYPDTDFVEFSSGVDDYDDDFQCPESLLEMMSIVRRIRDKSLSGYSFSPSVRRADDHDKEQEVVHDLIDPNNTTPTTTRGNNYQRFCASAK